MAFSQSQLDQFQKQTGSYHAALGIVKQLVDQSHDGAKIITNPTIGTVPFDNGFNATSFTKGIDPSNSSGTVPFGLDIINQIQGQGGPFKLLESIVGGNLTSLIQNFTKGLQLGINLDGIAGQITGLIKQQTANTANNQPTTTANTTDPTAIMAEIQSLLSQIQGGIV